MEFQRHLSKANTPVQDQVEWIKSTSRITSSDGAVIFEMLDVEHPKGWSKNAVDILAQKYFRKAGVPQETLQEISLNDEKEKNLRPEGLPIWLWPNTPKSKTTFGSETSAKQVFHRLAGAWTYWGWKEGIFAKSSSPEESAKIFYDELYIMLAFQIAAPNSPQFFNTGLHWAYGIEGSASGQWAIDDSGQPFETTNSYERPQPHACFIQPVTDDLVNPNGMLDLWRKEALLFKQGSGTGSNFSNIRSKGERISGGGISSGLMSFLEVGDTNAKSIQSGGTCLASWQKIYTEHGPMEVEKLAKREDGFICLSYDPPANRYKAKRAKAWSVGKKQVVRITTDKGFFDVTYDHPIKLSTGEFIQASKLISGQSLFACSIDLQDDHVRIHLKNGYKGKEAWARMIAKDILNWDIDGLIVHHVDENNFNNEPSNLEAKTQSHHAGEHARNLVDQGIHVFQTNRFPKSGSNNGMHSDSDFWKDSEKVASYKQKQSEVMIIGDKAFRIQKLASNQKMLNTAYKVINAGYSIETFKDYVEGRQAAIGRIPSITKLLDTIYSRFGNYENFVKEVKINNHRIERIELLDEYEVFDVEVDCPTLDDKSTKTGHNFVIWPNNEYIGSGIVVANTRRAAKMCILDLDHPEILEFINWKAHEEYKAACMNIGSRILSQGVEGVNFNSFDNIIPSSLTERLSSGGFTPQVFGLDWQGEAITSVQGQNSNNSVRITHRFLDLLQFDHPELESNTWNLINRTDGKVNKTISARDLWHQLCRSAWACGDPGVQFEDTINYWHTCKADGKINASNPCSEYLFLDDTACNLASLNLVSFLDKTTGAINTKLLLHATRLWTTVLEISVFMASFPSKEIALGSYNYRTLGLGYANLGSLLMRKALPYDSDQGRNLAANLTAIIHGQSYLTSFEMGNELGAFPRWEANKTLMDEVLFQHIQYAELSSKYNTELALEISKIYKQLSQEIVNGGCPRNAQVTNIAPTGTISFVMDCDTTGCEPSFQQRSFKSLAGGGDIILENQSIAEALKTLNYTSAQVLSILQHIKETGTIETWTLNGRTLPEEHLAVFDCANPGTGKRSISFLGHIKMVAVIQPFLSGGVSKTINLPNSATIEDVSEAYLTAHKLGVKSIALYRDGSKLDQPLKSFAKTHQPKLIVHEQDVEQITAFDPPTELVFSNTPNVISINSSQLPRGHRVRTPDSGQAFKQKVRLDGHALYITHGLYPDGTLGEIFLELSKEGSTVRALLNSFAKAISIGIQYGVPLEKFVESFVFTKFEPSGIVEGHEHVKMASSLLDLIFRTLAIKYLGQLEYSNLEAESIAEKVISNSKASAFASLSAALAPKQILEDCPYCKNPSLIRVGPSCSFCTNCKRDSGCG